MKNSELRQDIVSGDWILIAPGRLRYKNHGFKIKKTKREVTPKSQCPFENPFKTVSNKVLLRYDDHQKSGDWEILVLENKYPVVTHSNKLAAPVKHDIFTVMAGFGHHDLVITRSHYNNFPKLSPNLAFHVFEAFRDRYLSVSADKNLAYISIFHNWGPLAGASVYHPHYQMIAVPVVPPDVLRSLEGSARYFKQHKKCVHCLMIEREKKMKRRVIYENNSAIAFVPFVSRNPFEIRIFPKNHRPYFENTFDEELRDVAETLQKVLKLIEQKLKDPDYNFFIHTAPLKNKENYRHYHWHIEVYPKLSVRAGFEFGTGLEINIFDPDLVAKILKR